MIILKRLRYLPAIHALQKHIYFQELVKNVNIAEGVLTNWLNEVVDDLRNQIINDQVTVDMTDETEVQTHIFQALEEKVTGFTSNYKLRKVINATGVVLHTNLGRARLSERAMKHITDTASAYSTLEYNLALGERGSRHDLVEEYVKLLTGAEAALVVNNNAAAVFLVLKALATNKEVIVSRGELVEIGGSFRISEIMEESGARLIEIGTTNKTHLQDYNRALTENTGLILKVHKSNFTLLGFTQEVATEELVALAKERNIPIYEDLGSGTLFDFKEIGISSEPTVQKKVQCGIDIISFSGDKLLGGPQAGIIVGKKEYIDAMKRHQLARVLRVDKFTLAGLEATLKTYIAGREEVEIPTVRDIVTSKEKILQKAEFFVKQVQATCPACEFSIEKDISRVGGGTMPDVALDTYVVKIAHPKMKSEFLAKKLRAYETPIIVRVKKEAVLVDFRTVDDVDLVTVITAFTHIM